MNPRWTRLGVAIGLVLVAVVTAGLTVPRAVAQKAVAGSRYVYKVVNFS
jgi:hypothetical protein